MFDISSVKFLAQLEWEPSPIIGTPVRSARSTCNGENTLSCYPSMFSSTPIQSSGNNLNLEKNTKQNTKVFTPPDVTTVQKTLTL